MSVPRLSQKTAEKVAQATDYALELTQEGIPAVEALVKAADAYELTGEQGHLLVRGWNTACVRNLFEKSSSINDRLSDLDVVNINTFDELRKNVKPESKKAHLEEEAVWFGYDSPPPYHLPESQIEYQPEPDPSLPERMAKEAEVKIKKKFQEYESTVKLAHDEWKRIQGDIIAAIEEVKRAFFEAGIKLENVKENIKVAHPKAYTVLTALEDVLPHRSDYIDYPLYDPKKAPYSALIKCAEILDHAARFQQKYNQLIKQYKQMKSELGYDEYEDMAKYSYLLDPTPMHPGGFYSPYDVYYKPTLLTKKDVEEVVKESGMRPIDPDSIIIQGPDPNAPDPNALEPSPDPNAPPAPHQPGDLRSRLVVNDPNAPDVDSFTAPPLTRGKDKTSKEEKEKKQQAEQFVKGMTALVGFLEKSMDKEDLLTLGKEDHKTKIQERFFGRHAQAITKSLKFPGMIVRLIAGDEILANYPADKVQEAYTYLHEIAPTMMENLAVAREFVKKYLEQGETLDSYDMKLLVDMEAKRRRLKAIEAEE